MDISCLQACLQIVSKQLNIFDIDFGSKTIVYSFSRVFFPKRTYNWVRFQLIEIRERLWGTELPGFNQKLDVFQKPAKVVLSSNMGDGNLHKEQRQPKIEARYGRNMSKNL